MQLELRNVTVSLGGNKILNNVSLEVEKGEIVCLLGESGCGKSTLLKTIAGILKQDSGKIFIEGMDTDGVPVEKRDAVIVFQDLRLFPHMNVFENIEFGLKIRGIPREERIRTVQSAIDSVGLTGLNKRKVTEISGGQRQRVALARAIVLRPKLLLLDEPFSSLDESLKDAMRELVLNIQKQTGITTIIVTHDKKDALIMADKIAIMKKGEILQFGLAKDVYENPASKEVADYFGYMNYIKGRVVSNTFYCSHFTIEATVEDGTYSAMIRPKDLEITEDGDFEIESIKYMGDIYSIRVKKDGDHLTVFKENCSNFKINQKVGVKFDLSKIIYFKEKEN
ncbi:MAG TPA: ABC transporter ATP-binding protein [Clostridiaceae bacterium]|nr:ABC transporter ATP-binding protein [Clostridiaceae bacterium]